MSWGVFRPFWGWLIRLVDWFDWFNAVFSVFQKARRFQSRVLIHLKTRKCVAFHRDDAACQRKKNPASAFVFEGSQKSPQVCSCGGLSAGGGHYTVTSCLLRWCHCFTLLLFWNCFDYWSLLDCWLNKKHLTPWTQSMRSQAKKEMYWM